MKNIPIWKRKSDPPTRATLTVQSENYIWLEEEPLQNPKPCAELLKE